MTCDDVFSRNGSDKRPKGVGKRDQIKCQAAEGNEYGGPVYLMQAPWDGPFEVVLDPFDGSAEYVNSKRGRGYRLYTAKLKEVTE